MSRPVTLAFTALLGGALLLSGCGSGQATVLPTPSPTGLPHPASQATPTTVAAGSTATPGPAGSSGTPAGGRVATLDDDNSTLDLASGETFLLKLGTGFDWTVTVDDQTVLSRVIGVTVILGAQGIYRAGQPGTTTLHATGDPPCRKATPPCAQLSRVFRLQVRVH